MLKVSLTHDVDRTSKSYQYITHALRSIFRNDFEAFRYHVTTWSLRNKVYWGFDDIIAIEDHYGVKSTFYFLIESFPFILLNPSTWKLSLGRYNIHEERIQNIIRFLDRNGWEVGLHGSYASYNNFGLLHYEKKVLESIVGHPIIGIRQHYLNLNENSWWFQNRAGFQYDASWGYLREIGFKENKIRPFRPLDNQFIVFPLAIMDSCYMNSFNRIHKLQDIILKCIDNDAVLVLNWHSNNYHEKEFPGWKDAYIEVIEICMKYDANFQTLKEFITTE